MTSDSSTFHFNLGAEKGSVIPYVVLTFQVILGAPGRTQRNRVILPVVLDVQFLASISGHNSGAEMGEIPSSFQCRWISCEM